MPTGEELFTCGAVSNRVRIPRWRLLYLVERGALPGPTLQVPGRRLFTESDIQRIAAVLAAQPELRGVVRIWPTSSSRFSLRAGRIDPLHDSGFRATLWG